MRTARFASVHPLQTAERLLPHLSTMLSTASKYGIHRLISRKMAELCEVEIDKK